MADSVDQRWWRQYLPSHKPFHSTALPVLHQEVESDSPPLELGLCVWLCRLIEYSRRDVVWLLILGHERPCSFRPVHWNTCAGSPECHRRVWLPWGHHATRKPSYRERPRVMCCLCVTPAHVPEAWVDKPSDESVLQVSCYPQPLSLPGWGPRHHGAETSHLSCGLSKFSTHKHQGQNEMFLSRCLVWGYLVTRNSNWKNGCCLYCTTHMLGSVLNVFTHLLFTATLLGNCIIISLLYKWRSWHVEKLSNLPKVTHLDLKLCGTRVCTSFYYTQLPCHRQTCDQETSKKIT